MKKPLMAVSSDPLPKTITEHAHIYAPILTRIFNWLRRGQRWPTIWRREEVGVIPKGKSPEDFDSRRNISCTLVFSKLLETYMLDWINQEIRQEWSQIDGFKGSGTDHLIAELQTTIMEQLDDNSAAVSLISVDMADHSLCLEAMAEQGTSTQTIALVANFLMNCSMRIKLRKNVYSTSRQTPGGAPKGTKSGNILFCIGRH